MSMTIKNGLNLGAIRRDVDEASPDALDEAAQHVLDVARGKAPLLVDLKRANDERRANPGELRESGYSRALDDNTAEVGFSAFYAGWQHENVDYHHEDGEAKYLEIPLVTERDRALQIMADHVRRALGG